MGVPRSGGVNTALELARKLNPDFDAFTSGSVPTVPINADTPDTAICGARTARSSTRRPRARW